MASSKNNKNSTTNSERLVPDDDPTDPTDDWASLGDEQKRFPTSATSMEGSDPRMINAPTENNPQNYSNPSRTLDPKTAASFSFSSTSSMGPATSFSQNRVNQLQRHRQHPQVPLVLPLSMRLMKQVAGLCCLDCATNRNSNSHSEHALEDEPDLSMLLNYDLQALYCQPLGTGNGLLSQSSSVSNSNPQNTSSNASSSATTTGMKPKWHSSASPLVLAPMTMSVVQEEEEQQELQHEDSDFYKSERNHSETGISDDPDRPRHVTTTRKTTSNTTTTALQHHQYEAYGHDYEQTPKINNTAVSPTSSFSSPPASPKLTTPEALPPSGLDLPPPMPALAQNRASPALSSSAIIERIVSEYIAACRFYGVGDRLNAGVLTTLRFSLPCMRITGRFHDADMLALAEILLKYCNGPLRYIRRLDFSLSGKQAPPRWSEQNYAKGMHSHGAFTLAKVLQVSKYIEEVFLNRNRIGPYGASAIFIACSTNQSIKKLLMRRCRVFERGALVFAELVASSETTALQEIDLSANYIGVKGSMAIERALLQRMNTVSETTQAPLHHIEIDLEGNHVLQEVMNSITHGLGVILAVLGSHLMMKRVTSMEHLGFRHVMSCRVYSASLIVLYMSSTLYHSFFSMQNTKYIFEVFDKCAIYILIAGSYTPFLQIVLGHEPMWSIGLLAFIWCCCLLGITVEAMYPTWEHKMKFSLAMYLGMGWSALVCLPEIASLVPEMCINVMVLGGVGYTSGVPFFVRNNNLDHAVWHLFVLTGSIFHWCGVYFFVVDFELPTEIANKTLTDVTNQKLSLMTEGACAAH